MFPVQGPGPASVTSAPPRPCGPSLETAVVVASLFTKVVAISTECHHAPGVFMVLTPLSSNIVFYGLGVT